MTPTVVVIDDEPELCRLVQDLLQSEGYRVIGVERPETVEESVEGAGPDLFLVDIMLPGISGIELAQRLRGNGYDRMPMIGMSASRLMSKVANQSGVFSHVLDKPFDIADFLECVARHLRQGAAARPQST